MLTNINVRPRFEVVPLEGTREVTVISYERKKLPGTDPVKYRLHRVEKTKKKPNGFMVYFPKGHSLHVTSQKQLEQLGLAGSPTMVDMDSGEEAPMMNRSLQQVHDATMVSMDTRQRHLDGESLAPVEEQVNDID
jgi:hypothetical protein